MNNISNKTNININNVLEKKLSKVVWNTANISIMKDNRGFFPGFYMIFALILSSLLLGYSATWIKTQGENSRICGEIKYEIDRTIEYCLINDLNCSDSLNILFKAIEDSNYKLEIAYCKDNYAYNPHNINFNKDEMQNMSDRILEELHKEIK